MIMEGGVAAKTVPANKAKGTGELDKELESLYQPKAAVQKKAAARKGTRAKAKGRAKDAEKRKTVTSKGKRKRAVARATLTAGSGRILVNGVDVSRLRPDVIRELVLEPLRIAEQARSIAATSDIYVSVRGGGVSGQAQAARSAIAKAVASASGGDALRKAYLSYDRTLIVDDARRVEPKKFLGRKARARFQTSYR